jgi:ATP-dependent exoDNAse (exonuclease V) beta subunit
VSGHLTSSRGTWRADGWLKYLLETAGYDINALAGASGQWQRMELPNGAVLQAKVVAEEIPSFEAEAAAAPAPAAVSAERPLYRSLITPAPEAPPEEGEEEPRRDWRATGKRLHPPATVVGSMVHKAIECWSFPGDEGFDRLLAAVSLDAGLIDPEQQAEAVRRARALLDRFRAHSLWTEILASKERYHEVPYTRPLPGGRADSGAIDLLYRKGSEWILLDFKIDELKDALALQAAASGYRSQLERYAQAAQALLGTRPHAQLVFLDCMGEVRLEAVG